LPLHSTGPIKNSTTWTYWLTTISNTKYTLIYTSWILIHYQLQLDHLF
jgi:hypothetical protein